MNWQTIVDHLNGTCGSIIDALRSHDMDESLENDLDFCAFIDDQIFQCHVCGWWCEISEECSDDAGLEELTCRDCCDE
jgi:hypothetical protein